MPHIYDGLAEYILGLPGDLPQAVISELCRGWRVDEFFAEQRQREIAASQPERTTIDGIGQHTMSIDGAAYHHWGQKLGYKCWRDKAFRREFARDNPHVRVRTVPRKTCLRMDGFKK